MIELFTIGFTKKTAKEFFTKLQEMGIKRVIDVRLNNQSQLAGFTKKGDLEYFLNTIANIDYIHLPQLAPTEEILRAYRKKEITWGDYEERFNELIASRQIEKEFDPGSFNDACLLCSEHEPQKCHRRLVAEYLKDKWGDVQIIHLT